MNEHLVRAFLQLIDFIAYCDDEVLDEDVSVRLLEHSAVTLGAMSGEELGSLRAAMASVAASEPDSEKRQRMSLAFEHLGLEADGA